jgi:hypothetical protein
MRLASARPGDLIEVDKKGRRFIAHLEEVSGQVAFTPVCRGISFRTCSKREVRALWRRAGRGG